MQKKIGIIFMLFIMILTVSGCNKLTTYEEITYNQLMTKVENKDDFILFIGSSQCNHCATYKYTIDAIIEKYQIKVYYINVYNLDKEQNNNLNKLFPYQGTPVTIFAKNGEELHDEEGNRLTDTRVDGARDYDIVVEKLKKQGYIK